jgi:hypothetical protein
MKKRTLKRTIVCTILLVISCSSLWNCESDQPIRELHEITPERKRKIFIEPWDHWQKEHHKIALKVEKFRKNTKNLHNTTSSQYGFTIEEDKVQIVEHADYTTYTFVVKRETPTEEILENYLFKQFLDGSYRQYLLTYYYGTDSNGIRVLDPTHMDIEAIEDENLVLNRSSDCFPHFEEAFIGMNCTYRATCTGFFGHELGDGACGCTGLNGCYPAGETCEAEYGFVFNDCGGGSSGTDDNTSTNNPNDPTGGNANASHTNGSTHTTPFEEPTSDYDIVIGCLNGTASFGLPNVSLSQDLMNYLANEPDLASSLRNYIHENGCSIENETLVKEIIESSADGTLISVFPFVRYPEGSNYATQYPKLTEYLKNQLPTIKDNSTIVNAIKKYTDQSTEQIRKDLQWGYGPVIKIQQIGMRYGLFRKNLEPNSLYLDVDLVNQLESTTPGTSLADAFAFLMGVTVLHEYVHYGDYNYNGDHWQYPQEEGLLFEIDVYGQTVWIQNAEIILKNN